MRSLLFVPGDSERKLQKGLASGADALIVDLEDSVALGGKAEARRTAAAFLASLGKGPHPLIYVRVNDLASGLIEQDLDAVMPGRPDGIMLPKAVGGVDVQHLGAKLAVREAEHGIADHATRILAIATETARGLLAIGTMPGASSRLAGLAWGGEDLSADLGAESNRDESGAYTAPYIHARTMTLVAAAAAEVDAIDTVFTAYRDLDGLARECEAARRDGFAAKMAIHPNQVAVINRSFSPSPEAVAEARAIVEAFAAAPGAGVVGIDGQMVDHPHLKRAERVLRRLG